MLPSLGSRDARPAPGSPVWRCPLVAALALILVAALAPTVSAARTVVDGIEAYRSGDYEKAREIWVPLAEKGDAKALFNLGVLYDEGLGVPRDPEKARQFWEKAAERGLLTATHNLALIDIEQAGDDDAAFESALERLKAAADGGYARSQYALGKLYQYGLGVEKDGDLAIRYFEAAAEAGLARAQYNLGKAYRDGDGVEPDPAKAAEWFRRAAEQGDARAQDHYARRLATGDGVAADPVQGLAFALLAARQGNQEALSLAEELKDNLDVFEVERAIQVANAFIPEPAATEQ